MAICVFRRQMAGLHHAVEFIEWRRLHPIVSLLLQAPTEAAGPVGGRRRPASAGKLPPSCVVSVPCDSVFAVHGRFSHQPLYSRWEADGRWMFGRLPATSVSDTATASTSPLVGAKHRDTVTSF